MHSKVLLSLLFASCIQANDFYQINDKAIRVSESLGEVHLLIDDENFHVYKDGEIKQVENCFVDQLLIHVKKHNKLEKYFEKGCSISIIQLNDGEYKLKSNVPGLGGGPVSGAIAYWVTKGLCYGGIAAAGTTVTVATAGAAAPLLAGGAAVAGMSLGVTGAAATLATGIGAAAGTGGVAAGAFASGAALATGAAGAAGGAVGIVAGIETASIGVSAFFTMLPIP